MRDCGHTNALVLNDEVVARVRSSTVIVTKKTIRAIGRSVIWLLRIASRDYPETIGIFRNEVCFTLREQVMKREHQALRPWIVGSVRRYLK